MKKIEFITSYKRLLADVFTPVGIYLRLRDRFRDTILLESSDYNSAKNSFSFIGINAIAGIEIRNLSEVESKFPNEEQHKITIDKNTNIPQELNSFMQVFQAKKLVPMPIRMAQGLFGYTSYDAVQLFDGINFKGVGKNAFSTENIHFMLQDKSLSVDFFSDQSNTIPLIRYRFYQYVIAINHYKSELFICENKMEGIEGDTNLIESIIRSKDIPEYPFSNIGSETSSLTDENYKSMLKKGIKTCNNDEVSSLFLSREYAQKFSGDEFNVYRALRNINPGPYLFYFDYGDYRLFGSGNGISFKKEEKRKLSDDANPFYLMATNFPPEKLSGAPKSKAIELINQLEKNNRGYYGGSIGFVGFDGTINYATMVHTFLSKSGHLKYRAGTGLTLGADADSEFNKMMDESKTLENAIKLAVEHSN